ncbi:MAG: spore cortex biosynthesis protein YabQ [Bacillota bacterium]
MTPVLDQIRIFAYSAVLGIFVGLIFDVYRTIRGLLRPNKLITGFTDLVLWVFLTVTVFLFLLLINLGEVRAYVFIAMVSGLALYIKYFSRSFLLYLRHLFIVMARIWKIFWKTLFSVIGIVLGILFFPVRILMLTVGGIGRFVGLTTNGIGWIFAGITFGIRRLIWGIYIGILKSRWRGPR